MSEGSVLVVGGTGGLGRALATHYSQKGLPVTITGRDAEQTAAIADGIGNGVAGLAFDLAEPASIAGALESVGAVSRLALVAIQRDNNPIREYDHERALYLTTMKLVGYTETIHALADRFSDNSSVLLFGGRAKDWPYPGSTTVTTVNGGIQALIRALALQLAPVRFNAIHPGIVGDSPFWEGKDAALDAAIAKTPTGRLATMADVVSASEFLLENPAMNATDLYVDGGWMLV